MIRLLKAVLLDLGDTLVHMKRPWADVFHDNLESLHTYLNKMGLKLDFDAFAKNFISIFDSASVTADTYRIEIPMEEIIRKALRKSGLQTLGTDLNHSAMVGFYQPEIESWEPYDDTLETLASLKREGFKLGLVSNAKSDWAVHAIIEKTGISPLLDDVITSALVRIRKPRTEIFARSLADLKVKASDAVFVGDSLEADVGGARIAGMRPMHLRRRPLDSTSFTKADTTVLSLTAALEKISEWQKQNP